MKPKTRGRGIQLVLNAREDVAKAASRAGDAAKSASEAAREANEFAIQAAEAAKAADLAREDAGVGAMAVRMTSPHRSLAAHWRTDGAKVKVGVSLLVLAFLTVVVTELDLLLRALRDFGGQIRLVFASACVVGAIVAFAKTDSAKAWLAPAGRWLGLALAYGVGAWGVLFSQQTVLTSDKARAVSFGLLSIALLILVAVMIDQEAVTRSLTTETSQASTVLLLWSAVVVYAIAFVAGLAALNESSGITCPLDGGRESAAARDCILSSAWPDYLILLGVPGAAAAVAKARDEPADSSPSTEATNKVTEVQYFVFNVLAMLFVVGELWRYGRLGDVPDVLLGLTSASALTFALVKRLAPASVEPR